MARKWRPSNLPAPYLKRVWVDPSLIGDATAYPFCLPFLRKGFDLEFEHAITIIVGENGTGKSTLLEGIAALAGYDEAGGGKGYRPVDHSRAIEDTGATLAQALRASWLPKITTGWFFRAESFFSVARYLDEAAQGSGGPPPDFLSHSHGEGFLRFFDERCRRQGIFLFDEPESALSPTRQIEFLKLLRRMDQSSTAKSSWPRIRRC
jgi:predicted ATPase